MNLQSFVDNWDKYILIFKNIIFILCIIFLIYFLYFIIMLFFLFKKEKYKPYYAIIPFYNFYIFIKICKIPFWTIFVPVVNLVAFICSPYRLLKEYKCEQWMCNLSILFPYVFLPIIIFNEKYTNKKFKAGYAPFKTVFDIEKIEHRLENNSDITYIDNLDTFDSKPDNTYVGKTDQMIQNIESNAIKDEYFDIDIPTDFKESNVKVEEIPSNNIVDNPEDNLEMVEIFDTIKDEDGKFTTNDVDKLENKIELDNKIEVADTTNYKEYKELDSSKEAIAFGGEKKIENAATLKAKNEELKCPRCGSSLVGATNGICPGCGIQISNLVTEQ